MGAKATAFSSIHLTMLCHARHQVDEANIDEVRKGKLGSVEIFDLVTDPGEKVALPFNDHRWQNQLWEQYSEALKTFRIWPAVKR